MLALDAVTLVSIDGSAEDTLKPSNPEMHQRALLHSMRGIRFGGVRQLTFREPKYRSESIELVSIGPLDYGQYSRFVIRDLWKYIDTEFCLIVQWDGFVLNPSRWTPEFCGCDYVGAPWRRSMSPKYAVGNGGFSLRSQRFLELSSRCDDTGEAEDVVLCRRNREALLRHGCTFAEVNLARRFSFEHRLEDDQGWRVSDSFGFHGRHHVAPETKALMMQSKAEIESFYKTPDPWGFRSHPDDEARKGRILRCLYGFRFSRALDLGCGEGWVTQDLPARELHGYEISDRASARLPSTVRRVTSPEGAYDLVVATGVLYHTYDWESLISIIRSHAKHIVLTCNIKEWEVPEVRSLPGMIYEEEFPYREFTQKLRVYDFTS